MMKKWITLILAVVFCLAGSANAADLILISDAAAPGTDPEGDHEDDALVEWLESLGYTVDTSGMGKAYRDGQDPFDDAAKVAALKSAGMVLVSRRTSSGSYDSERANWNELRNPLLLMSGYLTRGEGSGKRWGWTTGGSGDASLTETDIELFDLGPLEPFFDWSEAPTPGEAPKSVYLPNSDGSSEFDEDAIVFGKFDGRAMMALIPEGVDFDALNETTDKYGVAGDLRGFIGHWGYDTNLNYGEGDPLNRRANWGDFITDGYKNALGAMISTMIPEPATIALLGLGGLVLLRRRRR
jgi:hypothetical protein